MKVKDLMEILKNIDEEKEIRIFVQGKSFSLLNENKEWIEEDKTDEIIELSCGWNEIKED